VKIFSKNCADGADWNCISTIEPGSDNYMLYITLTRTALFWVTIQRSAVLVSLAAEA